MYVTVRGDGSPEDVLKAIRTFSKQVKKEGVLEEVYSRQAYVKPSKKRKLKRMESIKRKKREERRVNKEENHL